MGGRGFQRQVFPTLRDTFLHGCLPIRPGGQQGPRTETFCEDHSQRLRDELSEIREQHQRLDWTRCGLALTYQDKTSAPGLGCELVPLQRGPG